MDIPREGSKQLIIIYLVNEAAASNHHGHLAFTISIAVAPLLVLKIIYVIATKKPYHPIPIFTPNSVD